MVDSFPQETVAEGSWRGGNLAAARVKTGVPGRHGPEWICESEQFPGIAGYDLSITSALQSWLDTLIHHLLSVALESAEVESGDDAR